MVKRSIVLERARAILLDPEKWTRHAIAKNAEGEDVLPTSDSACRFCALGAAKKVAAEFDLNNRFEVTIGNALDASAKKVDPTMDCRKFGARPIAYLNDFNGDEGRELVIKAYDLAISEAKEDEERGAKEVI